MWYIYIYICVSFFTFKVRFLYNCSLIRQTLTWNFTKILFSLWRMDPIFIRNFAVFNFLKVFYIVILDDGRIWAETYCNLSSTSDNIYVWSMVCIRVLLPCERLNLCAFFYYSVCRRDLMSVTYCPDKLCIAIYSHQSQHHEIHVRMTMWETVNVFLFSPWRLMGE
jgi:hypothetical protein